MKMRGQAMEKICLKLEELGFNFKNASALEFFARDGSWQATPIIKRVKKITLWEIDSKYLNTLLNISNGSVDIGDSFVKIQELSPHIFFDFINIDNPQGMFSNGKCEHFEALDLCIPHLSDKSVLTFNVNRSPFNYSDFPEWAKKRSSYYKKDATFLGKSFIKEFYDKRIVRLGKKVRHSWIEDRNDEYLSYYVALIGTPNESNQH